jgi:hypothetical protein
MLEIIAVESDFNLGINQIHKHGGLCQMISPAAYDGVRYLSKKIASTESAWPSRLSERFIRFMPKEAAVDIIKVINSVSREIKYLASLDEARFKEQYYGDLMHDDFMSLMIMRGFLLRLPDAIPNSVMARAELWKQKYNTTSGSGKKSTFIMKAELLEETLKRLRESSVVKTPLWQFGNLE